MDRERKCSHDRTFNERCPACEIVSLEALISYSQTNIERWTVALAKLRKGESNANR